MSDLAGSYNMNPVLFGFELTPEAPSYSFLIPHKEPEVNLLFDLSLRQDWEMAFPAVLVKGMLGIIRPCDECDNVSAAIVLEMFIRFALCES